MTNRQRLNNLIKAVKPKHGEQIPVLWVVKRNEVIESIDDAPIGADKKSQAKAQRRIDLHPRNVDGTPSVICVILSIPDNGRE